MRPSGWRVAGARELGACTLAALIVALALGSSTIGGQAPAAQPAPSQLPVYRGGVREVMVLLRALDRDLAPVSGLDKSEIKVFDEDEPAKIVYFEGNVSHSQLVVLADVSGSMGSVMEPLQGALHTFADLVSQDAKRQLGDVRLSLIPFSDSATTLVDRTSSPAAFKDGVNRLHTIGTTRLVDAVIASLRHAFGDRATDDDPLDRVGRRSRFLVLFTDGGENASRASWSEIESTLAGRDVVIYTVAFVSGTPDSDIASLERISTRSGGRLFKATVADLERIYTEIARDIRSHYLLAFESPTGLDPTRWRRIRVTTTRPHVTILARAGYCPDADVPCQADDGTFTEGQPKTWAEFVDANRNPGLLYRLKDRLLRTRVAYTRDTEDVVRDLGSDPLMIERVPAAVDRRRSSFVAYHASATGAQVSIDAEVCGLRRVPDIGMEGPNVGREVLPDVGGRRELVILSPDFKVSEGPRAGRTSPEAQDGAPTFQSELQFYLKDPSGRIPARVEVLCRRPRFLANQDLVDFSIQALEYGLKVRAREIVP